jgi:hypothetical protein
VSYNQELGECQQPIIDRIDLSPKRLKEALNTKVKINTSSKLAILLLSLIVVIF